AERGEDDRGDGVAEKPRGDLGGLGEVRRADTELRIHDGRVVANEQLVPRRRAALGDVFHALAHDALGELARVADGRRRHDELRRGAVMTAETAQTPDDV